MINILLFIIYLLGILVAMKSFFYLHKWVHNEEIKELALSDFLPILMLSLFSWICVIAVLLIVGTAWAGTRAENIIVWRRK